MMLFGMAGQYFWRLKSMKTFELGEFVRPLWISFIVFTPFWTASKVDGISYVAAAAAYQNGFFWKVVLDKEVKQMKSRERAGLREKPRKESEIRVEPIAQSWVQRLNLGFWRICSSRFGRGAHESPDPLPRFPLFSTFEVVSPRDKLENLRSARSTISPESRWRSVLAGQLRSLKWRMSAPPSVLPCWQFHSSSRTSSSGRSSVAIRVAGLLFSRQLAHRQLLVTVE